jgi:hypothetical protein
MLWKKDLRKVFELARIWDAFKDMREGKEISPLTQKLMRGFYTAPCKKDKANKRMLKSDFKKSGEIVDKFKSS